MTKIKVTCTICSNDMSTNLEWVQSNKLIMCETCCKSFTPVTYSLEEEEHDFIVESSLSDDEDDVPF